MKIKLVLFLLVFLITSAFSNCENKFFSFNVKNGNINSLNILENVTDTCKMTMIFEDKFVLPMLQKKLNYVNVKDFSLHELLNMLLSDRNLFYSMDKNQKVLKISYLKTKSYYIDYVSFTKKTSTTNKTIKTGSTSSGGGGGEDSTTMDFTSDFQFWTKIQSEINSILSRNADENSNSKAILNQDAGMLTVTGNKKQLDSVKRYVTTMMKRLHKEILIEAKLIEVTYDDSKTDGVDWSKFQLGISGSSDATRQRTAGILTRGFREPNYLIGYNFSIDGLISFLKTQGDVKIVSNPKVMTLNNQSAVINVGTEVNYRYDDGSSTTISNGTTTTTPSYTTDSTFVGVTLDITPQVTNDNFIMLKINPIVSEISKEHIDANGVPFLAPDIKIKQLSSIVKVKDGNKVLIGGLINKNEKITNTSVPLLSSIPFIGNAFKSKAKVITNSELIIVLIPHIVDVNKKPSLSEFDISISKKAKK
jgi:general secretion pathway protein D